MFDFIVTMIALLICGAMIVTPIALIVVIGYVAYKKTNKQMEQKKYSKKSSYFQLNIQNAVRIPPHLKNSILLAMGEEHRQSYFSEIFQKYGYTIDVALGGDLVLNKLSENDYGLVLLDLVLPYKSGIDVLEEVKEDTKYYNAPRISVLTNLGTDVLKQKLPELGILSLIGPFQNYTEIEIIASLEETISLISRYGRAKQDDSIININLNTTPFNYTDDNFDQWKYVLKRNLFSEEQKNWIQKLQIPYKRHAFDSSQCEDEIISLYADIALFTNSYLKSKGNNLDSLVQKLVSDGGYYSNVLYTLECVSEGEVEMYYKGGFGYNNDFSYRLLKTHLGEEFVKELKRYLVERIRQIKPANQETITKLGLSANGMPYLWWDPSGNIRSTVGINREDYKWVSNIPFRDTQFLKIEQCRLETIKLYLKCIHSLEEFLDNSSQSKATQNTLDKLFTHKINYGHSSYNLLEAFYKICENQVRKSYPATRLLNIEKEIEYLEKKFGTEMSIMIFKKIANLSDTITPPDADTLSKLISNNPFIWRSEIKNLRKILTQDNYLEQYSGAKHIISRYKTLNTIDKLYYELGESFLKFNKIIALYFFYKYYLSIKSEDNLIELPQKITKLLFNKTAEAKRFYNLIELDLPEEKALEEIKEIFMPKRREIKIDEELVKDISKRHSKTVKKLEEFIGEAEPEEIATVTQGADVPATTTPLSDLFVYDESKDELELDPVQIDLLRLFQQHRFRVPKSDLNLFAKKLNLFPNTLLSNINQNFYNVYEDQLLSEDGEYYLIDEYNISIINKYL
jgi:CheY-like chemotaxis protein